MKLVTSKVELNGVLVEFYPRGKNETRVGDKIIMSLLIPASCWLISFIHICLQSVFDSFVLKMRVIRYFVVRGSRPQG